MMKKTRYVLLIGLVGAACGGCVPMFGGGICTTEFVSGVNITVTDADGAPVSGAALTLSDGEFSETMEELSPGEYAGAGERSGTYTLTIEADGFEPVTIDDLVVGAGMCHVAPVSRTVTLSSILNDGQ